MPDVRMPDGTIVRNVPEGTTKEELQRKLQASQGEQPTQQTRTTPRTGGFIPQSTNVPEQEPEFNIPLDDRIRMFVDAAVENAVKQFDPRNLSTEELGDLGIVGGATVGARLGQPLGVPGMATGGILGAAIGASGKEAAQDSPLLEGATDIAREAALEAGGFGVARIFDGQLISKGLSKLFGVGDQQAATASSAARRQGIDLGITDVGNQIAKGGKTVLGVFPFVSQPFRQATARQQDQALSVLNQKLSNIAPNASLTQLGVDMTEAAKNSFKEFRTVADSLYTQADELADTAGNIVPTSPLKQTIDDLIQTQRRPITQAGETVRGPSDTELERYIGDLADLPENISVRELRSIQQDIGTFFNQARSQGFDMVKLARLKEATEQAMFNLDTSGLDPETASRIVDNYKTANNFYFENMKRFENPTARKFGRVDKNIFKPGRDSPGFTNQDEVVEQVFNSRSPQALSDLRSLVGEEDFLKASRRHIDKIFKTSFDKESGNLVFKPTEIKQKLGFGGPNEEEALDSLRVMLKGTRQSADDLKEFLDVAENIGNIVVPATMVKRRFILGGISSALRTFTMGGLGAAGTAAAPQSLFLTIPAIYMVRRGSRFLTDPNALRDMTKIMKSTTLDEEARAAGIRLLRKSLEEDSGERAQQIQAPAL